MNGPLRLLNPERKTESLMPRSNKEIPIPPQFCILLCLPSTEYLKSRGSPSGSRRHPQAWRTEALSKLTTNLLLCVPLFLHLHRRTISVAWGWPSGWKRSAESPAPSKRAISSKEHAQGTFFWAERSVAGRVPSPFPAPRRGLRPGLATERAGSGRARSGAGSRTDRAAGVPRPQRPRDLPMASGTPRRAAGLGGRARIPGPSPRRGRPPDKLSGPPPASVPPSPPARRRRRRHVGRL